MSPDPHMVPLCTTIYASVHIYYCVSFIRYSYISVNLLVSVENKEDLFLRTS